MFGFAALVLAADQLTKVWAQRALGDGQVVAIIGDSLRLVLVRNPGAAFSVGSGRTWIFTIVGLVISLLLLRQAWRGVDSRAWQWTIGMLLGGAIGNVIDRLVREPGFGRGHVVDFIDYFGWFVGNVADIAIVVGAALVALWSVRDLPMRRDPGAGTR